MITTYRYRFIRTSWGIAIDLEAEVVALDTNHQNYVAIAPGIWLDVDVRGLTAKEHEYLALGVRLVAPHIRAHAVEQLPLVIRVHQLQFNPQDYQEEGLACAMIGWAADVWKFEPPVIPIEYDRQHNRYVFHLPAVE